MVLNLHARLQSNESSTFQIPPYSRPGANAGYRGYMRESSFGKGCRVRLDCASKRRCIHVVLLTAAAALHAYSDTAPGLPDGTVTSDKRARPRYPRSIHMIAFQWLILEPVQCVAISNTATRPPWTRFCSSHNLLLMVTWAVMTPT
jgi:hypothetical protein